MANSDKNIVITPNRGLSGQPEIAITGLGNTTLSIRVSDSSSASLDFVTGTGTTVFSVSKEQNQGETSLSVSDINGVQIAEATNDGKVSLSSKSGKLYVKGNGLQLPRLNANTTSPKKEGVLIYDTATKEPVVSNGKSWVSMYSPKQTLSEAVGVRPLFHYQSSDLDSYADGTVFNTSNPWINNGNLGRDYDMINDTSGYYSTSITVSSRFGYKVALFSGFCSLAFRKAPFYNLVPGGVRSQWTVAYVYGGGSNEWGSNDSSPGFNGHGQGPSTNIPDRVGGGLFGWYNLNAFGGQLNHWWDNDGWTYAGNPTRNPKSIPNNITPGQWINRLDMGRQTSWYGKTEYPFLLDTVMNGGSLTENNGAYSAANMIISGMGNVRRADSSAYTCTGYLFDAVLFDVPLTDEKIQNLRDYYAAKYPIGLVNI